MLSRKTPFEDAARKEETTMRNILKQALLFPDTEEFDELSKDLISGLLQKNPLERLGSDYKQHDQITTHRYFRSLDFSAVAAQALPAPWVPPLTAVTDSSHFNPDA